MFTPKIWEAHSVSGSLSSLQVAAIIQKNNCITSRHDEVFKRYPYLFIFNLTKIRDKSPYIRIAVCRNLITHTEQTSVDRVYCKRFVRKNKIMLHLCECSGVQTSHWKKTIMIEGRVPPPFGLITPDALSPCLFTLLQQPGHEGVNKASSPSTAWIDTATRKLRSPSGPCQNVLCATTRFCAGGARQVLRSTWSPGLAQLQSAVSIRVKQRCNKQSGVITAQVILLFPTTVNLLNVQVFAVSLNTDFQHLLIRAL